MSTTYGYGGGYTTTTSYGGQGGAQGGGFMAGSQSGSQGSPGGDKGHSKDSLRPVTIKQLIDAVQPHADAEFTIDGVEVQQVTFVGQIRNLAQQATNTTYKLDDGTGLIEVKQWLDPEAPPKMDGLIEGAYCRVFGRMKSFNNKRHVGSHFIRPVTDLMETQMHLLEATYVHLYFTRGPPEAQNGGAGQMGGVKQEEGGMFVEQGNVPQQPAGRVLPGGLSATAKKVFQHLQNSEEANEGMHVNRIAAAMSLPANEVFKAGDELLGMGVIYTTVDDETWAVLEYN